MGRLLGLWHRIRVCGRVHTFCIRYVLSFVVSDGTDGHKLHTVSRPLFIEEHGLRLLLERDGVGVELSRESYEAGEWADAVQEAYTRGKDAKERKRAEGETGKRAKEGRTMASLLINWVHEWKRK